MKNLIILSAAFLLAFAALDQRKTIKAAFEQKVVDNKMEIRHQSGVVSVYDVAHYEKRIERLQKEIAKKQAEIERLKKTIIWIETGVKPVPPEPNLPPEQEPNEPNSTQFTFADDGFELTSKDLLRLGIIEYEGISR